jgi:hypothetical protein
MPALLKGPGSGAAHRSGMTAAELLNLILALLAAMRLRLLTAG